MRTMFVLLLISVSAIYGQSVKSSSEPLFNAVTGSYFALSVGDMQASTKWYSEKLGLKVVMNAPKSNKAAVTVLEGGGLIVELIQLDDAVPLVKQRRL